MPAQVVLASDVALEYRKQIKERLQEKNFKPLLVGFLANSDPAAKKYAEWTAKTCQETGVVFELREVARTHLEEAIVNANEDDKVNGIIVYYPVFGAAQDQYLQNCVNIYKDVEGLAHKYRYSLYHNIRFLDSAKTQKCILPCTPLAIVKILEHIHMFNPILPLGDRLHGKNITIVNRSEIVGRPLAAMLANDGAKVFSVDEHGIMLFHRGPGIALARHEIFETSVTFEEALALSDVVITGVPSKSYKIDSKLLKDGAVCVNFSTFNNFNPDIEEKASVFVSSVGKVTITMLERNLLRLMEYQLPNTSSSSTNCE